MRCLWVALRQSCCSPVYCWNATGFFCGVVRPACFALCLFCLCPTVFMASSLSHSTHYSALSANWTAVRINGPSWPSKTAVNPKFHNAICRCSSRQHKQRKTRLGPIQKVPPLSMMCPLDYFLIEYRIWPTTLCENCQKKSHILQQFFAIFSSK